MECLPFGFMLVLVVGAFVFNMAQGKRHKEALERLAAQHQGLRLHGDEVRGDVDGVSVRVDSYTTGSGKSKSTWTRFRMSDPRSLNVQQIASEGLFSGMGKLLTGEDVQLGDPRADGKLLLRGPEGEIVSHMNAETRHHVLRAVLGGWEHAHGEWTARRRGKMKNATEMNAVLAKGFDAVRALRRKGGRDEALVEMALHDPVDTVRVRALDVRLGSATPLTSTQEEQLLSLGGLVSVRVAEHMGVRGVPFLEEALQTSRGDVRLRAAIALSRHDVGTEAVRAVLVQALTDTAVLPAVIPALGRVGKVSEVPALKPIADSWTDGNRHLAKKAVRAIQSRASGSVGQLSLADSVGGGVALAEEESEEERLRRAQASKQRQRDG